MMTCLVEIASQRKRKSAAAVHRTVKEAILMNAYAYPPASVRKNTCDGYICFDAAREARIKLYRPSMGVEVGKT